MIHDSLSKHQRELEARTLPRQPRDVPSVPAVELVELLAAVRARGERDGPVGMQMIDVVEWKKRMQRRVDRRGDAVLAEGAQRIEGDHFVFVRFAAVAADQPLEPVEVQHREPRVRDRPEVAAAPLYRHHADRFAGQRIGQLEFRARVASAEVRDPQIRAEKIRSITKEAQRIAREPRGLAAVPHVLEEFRLGGYRIRHT